MQSTHERSDGNAISLCTCIHAHTDPTGNSCVQFVSLWKTAFVRTLVSSTFRLTIPSAAQSESHHSQSWCGHCTTLLIPRIKSHVLKPPVLFRVRTKMNKTTSFCSHFIQSKLKPVFRVLFWLSGDCGAQPTLAGSGEWRWPNVLNQGELWPLEQLCATPLLLFQPSSCIIQHVVSSLSLWMSTVSRCKWIADVCLFFTRCANVAWKKRKRR